LGIEVRILGLDTATWEASIGLRIEGELVAEISRCADGSHAVSLLSLIEEVLQRGGCSVRDLDAVAVSGGPGSFTGLRIGLSVAKGLAYAIGARLIAIPTLEALARTVPHFDGKVCPVLDARKGELYAACFQSSNGALRRLTEDLLLTPEELLNILPIPCVILGDAVPVYGPFLQRSRCCPVTLTDPAVASWRQWPTSGCRPADLTTSRNSSPATSALRKRS
jgi:tRNA threonylcarbamoyladenosine biosynthesis protein TsaB